MNFNTEQKKVINAQNRNILCLASAGSGKTATMIERVKKLLNEGKKPSKIVCFTFTNQAATEMRNRLGEDGKEMFIGTIHEYANYLCIYTGVDTRQALSSQDFDSLISIATKIPYGSYPSIDYLFVDEFQDTDPLQYSFICKLPVKYRFYVGDEKQFIYAFKAASDRFIRELATDDNFAKFYLREDYRNPPNILKFANNFIGSSDRISPFAISVIRKNGFLDDDCSFQDAVEEITWGTDYTGWAILCRTNEETEIAEEYLDSLNIPSTLIRRRDLELDEMNNLLQENRVKIMTVHASKGLGFPHVVAVGCKVFNEDERRISYVAATRAMKSLYWCPTIVKRRSRKNKIDKSKMANQRIRTNPAPTIVF